MKALSGNLIELQRVGMTATMIERQVVKLGLEPRAQRYNKGVKKALRKYYSEMMPLIDVAIKENLRLTLPDTSQAIIIYSRTNVSDDKQKAAIYRWHNSEQGKEQLRRNAVKMRAKTGMRSVSCANCGQPFETRHPSKTYCSPACAYAGRVARTPEHQCSICGTAFRSIDPDVQTCSYRCGWQLRRNKGSLQPNGR